MDGGVEVDKRAGAAVQAHRGASELGIVGNLANAGDAASEGWVRMDYVDGHRYRGRGGSRPPILIFRR